MQSERDLCEIVDRMLHGPAARFLSSRQLHTGQLIYGSDEGEEDDGALLVVRSGRLRCFASFEGRELTLFTLEPGEAIHLHPGTMLEVRRDGEAVVIPTGAFRMLAEADPALALAAMPIIDRLLQKSIRMIENMAFHGVKYRLIRALCDTADREGRQGVHGIVIDQPPNAEDLAMQIGATRQTVSTVLAELIRCGVLRRFGSSAMIISDLGRLQQELAAVGR
jgi:CRP-like cAMP-binding protein